VRFRPATHLVVLVYGSRADAEALRKDVAQVLAPTGLPLSEAKSPFAPGGAARSGLKMRGPAAR